MIVSVVVSTFNHSALLSKCLDSLARMEPAKNGESEILIIDNNSTDDTKLVADKFVATHKSLNIRYIFEPHIGLSVARNTAIEKSQGSYLAFIDDDAQADRKWLVEIIRTIRDNPDIAAFGGPVRSITDYPPIWFPLEIAGYNLGKEEKVLSETLNEPIGTNMILSKKVMVEAGGFDTNLGVSGKLRRYGEDTEMIQKIIRKGLLVKYIPTVKVDHQINKQKLGLLWRYMRIIRVNNTCIRMAKNTAEQNKFVGVTFSNAATFLKRSIYYLVRNPFKFLFLVTYSLVSIISLEIAMLQSRVQK